MAGQPSAPCSPPSSSPSSSPSRRTSRLLASESERDRLVVTIARATSLQSKWGFELLLGTENYVSVHVMERRHGRASDQMRLLGRLLTPEGERLTSGDVYWPDGERLASGRLVFAFPKVRERSLLSLGTLLSPTGPARVRAPEGLDLPPPRAAQPRARPQ